MVGNRTAVRAFTEACGRGWTGCGQRMADVENRPRRSRQLVERHAGHHLEEQSRLLRLLQTLYAIVESLNKLRLLLLPEAWWHRFANAVAWQRDHGGQH